MQKECLQSIASPLLFYVAHSQLFFGGVREIEYTCASHEVANSILYDKKQSVLNRCLELIIWPPQQIRRFLLWQFLNGLPVLGQYVLHIAKTRRSDSCICDRWHLILLSAAAHDTPLNSA